MRELVIDTASEACSIALFDTGLDTGFDKVQLLGSAHQVLGRGHAERLIPMIADLPDKGQAERIFVSLGPGSFTGTRIGLAAARALGVAWSVPVQGYPTLGLIAAMAREEHGLQPVCAAMAGGHGEFYVQEFDAQGLPTGPHRSLKPEVAAAQTKVELVAGNRAEPLVAQRGYGIAVDILPDARAFPHLPQALYSDRLSPIYGRPPDAKAPV